MDELESFVPIRSINKDRGNPSKRSFSFEKVKKSTHGNVKILNKKMKVKDGLKGLRMGSRLQQSLRKIPLMAFGTNAKVAVKL